ncbi:MAG: Unknown protein [uncultured Sulfurovum sp.]|uniref:Uncharacterized protein n=1 Tax=uncultured Sulfurovum sp. TaxID=269237 RepID=A0A6S6SKY8_9BACT|nr:MAG: Unknown protein [uncultured Sulfurovum sp.]
MILTLSIVGVYMKTEHVVATASVWAILMGIIALMAKGISLYLFVVPVVFVIGWGIFSLATYFEESIFLRVMVLVFAMFMVFKSFGG